MVRAKLGLAFGLGLNFGIPNMKLQPKYSIYNIYDVIQEINTRGRLYESWMSLSSGQ